MCAGCAEKANTVCPELLPGAEMATYLLDTNVIIHVLRGRKNRINLLADLLDSGHLLASCPITISEIYAGMKPTEENRTRAFIESLQFLPMSAEIAADAGIMKRDYALRGQTLSLSDAAIAATAIAHRCILVAENTKDFPMPRLSIHPM